MPGVAMLLLVLIAAVLLHLPIDAQQAVVQTDYGPVRGRSLPVAQTSVYVFKGIPYAAPPLGDLRWKYPQPPQPWTRVLEANASTVCAQTLPFQQPTTEDCLQLHVYTPTLTEGRSLAVMVWLHSAEAAAALSPHFAEMGVVSNVVARDVVVVLVNYRLGVFGYLSTDGVGGNFGLLDQLMALKWTRRNIHKFGGSAQKVTLAGSGTGADSAALHSLSPLSRNYFNKLILQSGSAFRPGVIEADGGNENATLALLSATGCYEWRDGLRTDAAVDCLRRRSTADILRALKPHLHWRVTYDGSFLPRSIVELAKERRPLPAIIGINQRESAYFEMPHIIRNESHRRSFTRTFMEGYVKRWHTEPLLQKTTRAIYVDTNNNHNEEHTFWFQKFTEMKTDADYAAPAFMEARSLLAVDSSAVYLYSFDYQSKNSLPLVMPWKGVFHGSELQYVLGSPGVLLLRPLPEDRFLADQQDETVSQTFGELWTNFVKHENPTPTSGERRWTPVERRADGSVASNYYSIGPLSRTQTEFYPLAVHYWLDAAASLDDCSAAQAAVSERACHGDTCVLIAWLAAALALLLALLLLVVVVVAVVLHRQKTGKLRITAQPRHYF